MFALWRHLRTESKKQLMELLNTMTCEIWKLIFLWGTGMSFQPVFFQPNSNSRGDKEASCIPLIECSSSLCTFHWYLNITVQWDWMATILPWNTETTWHGQRNPQVWCVRLQGIRLLQQEAACLEGILLTLSGRSQRNSNILWFPNLDKRTARRK